MKIPFLEAAAVVCAITLSISISFGVPVGFLLYWLFSGERPPLGWYVFVATAASVTILLLSVYQKRAPTPKQFSETPGNELSSYIRATIGIALIGSGTVSGLIAWWLSR